MTSRKWNKKAMQRWLTYEAPYAAFWVTTAFALVCLVGAVVGLIGWVWLFLAVAGIVGTLHAIHRVCLRRVYEAEADRLMDRVMERLKSSHPNGGVTFDEYVAALRAEGVPGPRGSPLSIPDQKRSPDDIGSRGSRAAGGAPGSSYSQERRRGSAICLAVRPAMPEEQGPEAPLALTAVNFEPQGLT